MLNFSKSRVLYYHNNPNELKGSSLKSDVKVSVPHWEDANNFYKVGTVAYDKHGWHNIPTNYYGLYLTKAELYSLYENFESFQPESIQIVTGHAIPIAQYTQGTNALQLSFNNTIYSLIYDNNDTDWVSITSEFKDEDDLITFCRTFDGASYKDNTRVDLPKPNIVFKLPTVPDMSVQLNPVDDPSLSSKEFAVLKNTDIVNSPALNVTNSDAITNNVNALLTSNDILDSYLPEFLQDNQNVKVLYPGENQDIYSYNAVYPESRINCSGPCFGEHYLDTDNRSYGLNTNFPFTDKQLVMNVFPVLKGPIEMWNEGAINRLDHHSSYADKEIAVEREVMQNLLVGRSQPEFYTQAPGQKFIKGIPILDPAGNLVHHSFCVLVTWSITINGEPKKMSIPKPLHYGFANYGYRSYYYFEKLAEGAIQQKNRTSLVLHRNWPQKSTTSKIKSHYTKRLNNWCVADQKVAESTDIKMANNPDLMQQITSNINDEFQPSFFSVASPCQTPSQSYIKLKPTPTSSQSTFKKPSKSSKK
jgi:hypothetical protein